MVKVYQREKDMLKQGEEWLFVTGNKIAVYVNGCHLSYVHNLPTKRNVGTLMQRMLINRFYPPKLIDNDIK